MKRCLRCSRNFRNCKHVRQWGLTEEEFQLFNQVPVHESVSEDVIIEKIKQNEPINIDELIEKIECKAQCETSCTCENKEECTCNCDNKCGCEEEKEEEMVQDYLGTKEMEDVVEKVVEDNHDEFLSMETREENVMEPIGGACCGGNCKANENANTVKRHVDAKKSQCAILAYQQKLAQEEACNEKCPKEEMCGESCDTKEEVCDGTCPSKEAECTVENVAVDTKECECYTLHKVALDYVDYFVEFKNRL
ncbi:hypothetical protein [Mycoplasmopsis verecunda]|uniref:Uncharacterized protein n=1 Tax=Mycoplasmopsis verecunda TaxID=171291 RepID=A0A1T4LYT4_9BACT|nr:hypothetical protein [Mycoplasmopsis verecunda]WPB54470.1 hypothetical protein SAM46_03225 [Mycoplasmopsis verecunda]SJZ59899.1 hypothetical protein SAMN02745154_00578 [Mycoplasmopsis verecunda]